MEMELSLEPGSVRTRDIHQQRRKADFQKLRERTYATMYAARLEAERRDRAASKAYCERVVMRALGLLTG